MSLRNLSFTVVNVITYWPLAFAFAVNCSPARYVPRLPTAYSGSPVDYWLICTNLCPEPPTGHLPVSFIDGRYRKHHNAMPLYQFFYERRGRDGLGDSRKLLSPYFVAIYRGIKLFPRFA